MKLAHPGILRHGRHLLPEPVPVPSHSAHGTIAVSMLIDRAHTIDTLARLVQINSVNPTLVPGAPGEHEIATYVAGWLESAGLDTEILASQPGRTSVLGRLAGTG